MGTFRLGAMPMASMPNQTITGHGNYQAAGDLHVHASPGSREQPSRKSWYWVILAIVVVVVVGLWLTVPRISIAKPLVDAEVFKNDQTGQVWNVYYFAIPIVNESYVATIHIMDFQLAKLERLLGSNFISWGDVAPTSLSPILPSHIPPRGRVMVPFARVYPADLQMELGERELYSGDVTVPQFRFMVMRWLRKMTSHIEPGNYRFKLVIFLENGPPAEASFKVQWPGEKRGSATSTVEEIRVEKL